MLWKVEEYIYCNYQGRDRKYLKRPLFLLPRALNWLRLHEKLVLNNMQLHVSLPGDRLQSCVADNPKTHCANPRKTLCSPPEKCWGKPKKHATRPPEAHYGDPLKHATLRVFSTYIAGTLRCTTVLITKIMELQKYTWRQKNQHFFHPTWKALPYLPNPL